MASKIEMVVKLPSQGKPYEDKKLVGDIKITMITGLLEKKIYGSTSPTILDDIIKECVISPKIDPTKLTPDDKQFLLMKIRIHSYGPDYHVEGTCPECGYTKEYVSSLDEMEVKEYTEEWKEPIEEKLPVSGDTITVRALRVEDQNIIQSRVKRVAKNTKTKPAEQEFITTLAQALVSINGEEKSITEREFYIQNLTARDLLVLKKMIRRYSGYGYQGKLPVKCESCGEEYEAPVVLGYEFFHPDLD